MLHTKVAFVNVGVNSTHGNLKSPIFEDRTFEFVPIPDRILETTIHDAAIRYENLRSSNGIEFKNFIPSKYHKRIVHADPDFEQFTYGDYPSQNPKASNLKKIVPGDFLIFFARLVPWMEGRFCGQAGFHLIGFLEIDRIFKNIIARPEDEIFGQISTNAHIIRGKCDPSLYDGFWIFKGTKKSRRLKRAIPLDKAAVERVGFVDRFGHKWNWRRFRSDVAAIGAYLRTVKVVTAYSQVDEIIHVLGQ